MPTASTTRQLAEELVSVKLGRSLAEYVSEKRAVERPRWGWRLIAQQLKDDTGLDLSHEALRNWYGDEASAA